MGTQKDDDQATAQGVKSTQGLVVPFEWPYGSTWFKRLIEKIIKKERRWLRGEIRIGEKFYWEPGKPAMEEIEVTDVFYNVIRKEWFVKSKGSMKKGEYWNDASRFREACVRIQATTNDRRELR